MLVASLALIIVNRICGLVIPSSSKYLVDNVIVKGQMRLLPPLLMAAVEVDRIDEVLFVAKAPSGVLHPPDLGIEVEQVKKEIRVVRSEPGKPFARAGVRKGDTVVAISGTKVSSVNEFRRALRRVLCGTGESILDLRRKGKACRVEVEFAKVP